MSIRPLDLGIAAVLVCLGAVQLVSDPPDRIGLAVLLSLLMAVPVAVRRLRPTESAVAVSTAVGAYSLLVEADPPFCGFVALLVVAYTVVREGTLGTAVPGLVSITLGVVVTGLAQPTATLDWLYPLVYLGGAATIGGFVRQRANQQRADTAREIRLAVVEERSRMARELHDVVAHGLGVMILHAEAADELLDVDPAAAHSSLGRIQVAGRDAVGELALMLSLLRDIDDPGDRFPQPMIGQLPALVAEWESPERVVTLTSDGPLDELPTGLQLTVFRVVQESLTNVAKHSGAGRIDVTLTLGADGLVVDVIDSGPARGRSSSGTGHGLVGMRERARLYGGSLEAGARGAGFAVRLQVPTP